MSRSQAIPGAAASPASPDASSWTRARQRVNALLERGGASDRASLVVDAILIALISLSVLAIVLESVESLHARYKPVFVAFESATIAIFSVEYLLRTWCAVENPRYRTDAGPRPFARWRYALSPAAVIDLLAILPFYLVLFGFAGPGDMRFLRAVRLLRVLKLTRYSAAFDTLIRACSENARSFVAALFILIIVMLLAATGMYYFERTAQPQAFSSIPASMWWAFATLTTVGYGDVTPVTAGGKVFGALITVVGVGMVALPTGILASAYTEQLRIRADAYRSHSRSAWEDGVLTLTESLELERLREELGIGRHTASRILDAEQVRAALAEEHEARCPHCGAAPTC